MTPRASTFTPLDSVGGVNEYRDTTVRTGRTYYYRVYARSGALEGPASNVASATPAASAPSPGIRGRAYEDVSQDDPQGPRPPMGTVTLTPVASEANVDAGIDYYAPDNSIVLSTGNGTIDEVFADGSAATFAPSAGTSDEVKIATVRPGDAAGFLPGDLFVGNGKPGEIARITDGGGTSINPWLTLPTTADFRGALQVDRGGAFGGDLVALTTDGEVWLVDPNGNYAKDRRFNNCPIITVGPRRSSTWAAGRRRAASYST